jgi:hypothetical protein
MMQWRDKPRDLDLHLLSFNCNTSALVTHCYYGKAAQRLGLERGECLFLDHDDTRGNGCETLTLGQDGKGDASMNRQHAYVWMVHQYSGEAPGHGSMSGEYMSVAFSGMINCSFTGDGAAVKISGPQDARWWMIAVAKFDPKAEVWRFTQVNKFLPTAETGCTRDPNVCAILPYINRP